MAASKRKTAAVYKSKKKKHSVTSLPVWAQDRIRALENRVQQLERERATDAPKEFPCVAFGEMGRGGGKPKYVNDPVFLIKFSDNAYVQVIAEEDIDPMPGKSPALRLRMHSVTPGCNRIRIEPQANNAIHVYL